MGCEGKGKIGWQKEFVALLASHIELFLPIPNSQAGIIFSKVSRKAIALQTRGKAQKKSPCTSVVLSGALCTKKITYTEEEDREVTESHGE